MGKKASTLLVAAAAVTLLLTLYTASATASTLPHRHRHHRPSRRCQSLQDQLDHLDLRLKTDHIRIANLQKALAAVQVSAAWASVELRNVYDDDRKRRGQEQRQEAVHVSNQEDKDAMLLLRQEVAALRSEIKVLKEARAAEYEQRSAHSTQQEQREAITASWVIGNVRRLQEAVEGLQEAVNVTAAMHDKQEVESRLSVVGRDLAALRSSLSSVTSKAESAAATAETVREDVVRTAVEANQGRGKTEALATEVSSIREELNNLLSILPEGLTLRGLNTTLQVDKNEGGKTVDSGSHAHLQKVNNSLHPEPPHSPHPLFTTSVVSQGIRQVSQSLVHPVSPRQEQQFEARLREAESGLGELKVSSIQLLEAVESLEGQVDSSIGEVRQEVAKLEYTVVTLQDSAKLTRVPSDGVNVKEVMDRLRQLEAKISDVESSKVKCAEVTSDSLDNQTLEKRLHDLEFKLSASHSMDNQTLEKRLQNLEYIVSASQSSSKTSEVPQAYSDSDMKTLSKRLDQLALSLATVDSRASIAECQSSQLALNNRLSEALVRLEALEESLRR